MKMKMSLFHLPHTMSMILSKLEKAILAVVKYASDLLRQKEKELSGYKFPSFFLDKNFVWRSNFSMQNFGRLLRPVANPLDLWNCCYYALCTAVVVYVPRCYWWRKCPPWEINAYFLSFDPFSIHFSFLLFSSLVCMYRRALTQHKLHNFSFYVCCCLTLCRCDVPEEQMFPLSFFCLHRIISTLWQIKNDIITENDSRGDHKPEFQMIGWNILLETVFFSMPYWRLLTFAREEGDVHFIWLMSDSVKQGQCGHQKRMKYFVKPLVIIRRNRRRI